MGQVMAGHKIKSETGFAFLQYSDPQSQILTYKAIFWLKVKKLIFWPTKLDSDILAQCQRSLFSDPQKPDSDLQGYFLAQSKRAMPSYSDPKSQILTYKVQGCFLTIFSDPQIHILVFKAIFWLKVKRAIFSDPQIHIKVYKYKAILWLKAKAIFWLIFKRLFSDPHSHVLT